MPNAIFIDTSNLNALFKVSGKFVLGINYASCPERIAIDAQALGASFDVYLSVWPRQKGESEDFVNSLSVGGVPFVAVREEMDAVLKLVEKIPGVGTIYVCNALANFMIQSRVANFKSVINYGNRIALVTVKNKLLEDLKVYETADDLYADQGEGFTCYGDLDLIDVDAIKAQYEELTSFNKNVIVPLAHLITSYRSPYNVEAETVRQELYLGEYESERPEKPKPQKREIQFDPDEDYEEEMPANPVVRRRPRISLVNVGLVLVILAGAAICGLGYSFSKTDTEVSQLTSNVSPFSVQAQQYNSLASVYTSTGNVASFAAEVLSYAKTNPAQFTVAGIEVSLDSVSIRCNTTNEDNLDKFKTYLEDKYIIGEVNSLDTTQGAGGVSIYNYLVTVLRG